MDCNKTIDFFIEKRRLCSSCATCEAVTHDEQCPLFDFCGHPLIAICAEDTKKAIENLQKWSDEHPRKTYAQDFLEKFPDAPRCKLVKGRFPSACRKAIYGGKCTGIECDECWNEPMEE